MDETFWDHIHDNVHCTTTWSYTKVQESVSDSWSKVLLPPLNKQANCVNCWQWCREERMYLFLSVILTQVGIPCFWNHSGIWNLSYSAGRTSLCNERCFRSGRMTSRSCMWRTKHKKTLVMNWNCCLLLEDQEFGEFFPHLWIVWLPCRKWNARNSIQRLQ